MAKKPDTAAANPADETPAVSIACTQPGFRRAGMAHPAQAEYPAGTFSAEQLAALQAETKLIVTILPDAA